MLLEERFAAHLLGPPLEPRLLREQRLHDERHDHRVVGRHALRRRLEGVLVDLAPRDRFGGRTRRQRSVRHGRRRDLHVVRVPRNVRQTEHLRQRRLGLQVVVLRHAAAEDQRPERLRVALAQSPQVVRARLEDFLVQIEVEGVRRAVDLRQRPQLHRVQEDRPVARRTDENGDRFALAQREQAFARLVLLFLRRIAPTEQPAHLGAGHLALELRFLEYRRDVLVLTEQHFFVEADVRDADRALVTQCCIGARDRHGMERMFLRVVEGAVPVVVADGVGRRHVREPTRVEQRVQPRVVLTRRRDRPRRGQRHRQTLPDRFVEQRPQPSHVTAAEARQAALEQLVELVDFRDGLVNELARGAASRAETARILILPGGHGGRV